MRVNVGSQSNRVAEQFPDGLTPQQFRLVTLESADETGQVYPPLLADWFAMMSLLIGMFMDELITRRAKPDESGPWFITDKGKAWKAMPSESQER